MKAITKVGLVLITLGLSLNVQAYDKKQVKLDTEFWGKWTIFNAKLQCSETYQFSKPGQVRYSAKQKTMSGDFAILRSPEAHLLDVLAMKIKTDNKQAGCNGEKSDYTNADIRLGLKWISGRTAELCTDDQGKQCTGLYLIKQ